MQNLRPATPQLERPATGASWPARLWGGARTLRDLAIESWREFQLDDGGSRAAAIAFYILFSLFPLTVALALALLYLIGPVRAQAQVMVIAAQYLPADLGVVSELVENVIANRGTLGLVALPALLWGSLQIFRVLERAINRAWGAPRPRNFWHNLRFSLLMIGTAGTLTFGSLMLSALFRVARTFDLSFMAWRPLSEPVIWFFVSATPPFLLMLLLFTMLYRSVPRHMSLGWRDVLPGGLAAALMWELAKRGFALYLFFFAQQNYNLLYGSLGVLLALMTWAYLVGFIIVLGAEFSATWVRHRRAADEASDARAARPSVWKA